jgi:hypothetical protein
MKINVSKTITSNGPGSSMTVNYYIDDTQPYLPEEGQLIQLPSRIIGFIIEEPISNGLESSILIKPARKIDDFGTLNEGDEILLFKPAY